MLTCSCTFPSDLVLPQDSPYTEIGRRTIGIKRHGRLRCPYIFNNNILFVCKCHRILNHVSRSFRPSMVPVSVFLHPVEGSNAIADRIILEGESIWISVFE